MSTSSPNTESKFHAFNRFDTVYSTLEDGTEVGVTVFVPRSVESDEREKKLPVHVRWHGGALINGQRDYEGWIPGWIIDFAARHNAILITPDYRLLPESPGLDILSDIHVFWSWLHSSLPSNIKTHYPHVAPNLHSILVSGESAGGYMAAQSALLADIPGLKAAVLHYPMLDLKDDFYSKPGRKNVWGNPPPEYPEGWLERQLEDAKHASPVTHRIPNEADLDIFVALLEDGRYTEVLGSSPTLFPLENLEIAKKKGKKLLPMWILHSKDDTVIPIQGTEAFLEKARDTYAGDADIHTTILQGLEHGFDNEGSSLDDGWVREGVKWVERHWP